MDLAISPSPPNPLKHLISPVIMSLAIPQNGSHSGSWRGIEATASKASGQLLPHREVFRAIDTLLLSRLEKQLETAATKGIAPYRPLFLGAKDLSSITRRY